MRNADVAQLLDEIASLLEVQGDNQFRVNAYREAARRIDNLVEDVAEIHAAGELTGIPGVGKSIACRIDEYLTTGRSAYLESLRRQVGPGLVELLEVPGIGPAKARMIHEYLGVKTLGDLARAARAHELQSVPGIGEKSESRILREIERLKQRSRRMLLGVALPAAEEVINLLRPHPEVQRISTAGSIRRMKETIGDIDILVASWRAQEVMHIFTSLPIVREVLATGPTKSSILTEDNLQMDLRVVGLSTYGAALQYFTGSKPHNIALRDLAIEKGMKVSEYGVFDDRTGRRIGGETEEEVYELLGLRWIPPELRENRGEIEAAARGTLPKLVELGDLKGDLHVHSDWSDGTAPIEAMARAARDRGYRYMALTDHSQSLRVAHGLSPDRVREQRRIIDRLNRQLAPFRILASTECDIRMDGTLDYDDDLLEQFDFVTASVHSGFRMSSEAMTERIERALRSGQVDLLNHPTGRRLGKRPAYEVDLERVLRTAKEYGVAVEIDGSPERMDLDDVWARRARELGLQISIDSDAHDPANLDFIRYGLAVARRGWLEPHNVLNTGSVEKLLARAARRKRAA